MRRRIFTSFQGLPGGFPALFDRAGHAEFDLTLPWFENFEATVLPGIATPRLYGVEHPDDGEPLALLPLQYPVGHTGHFSLRALSAMSNYYTSVFGPAVAGSEDLDEALRVIVDAIGAERPRWDALDLKPLDVDGPAFAGLERALRGRGWLVQPYFCFGNWYLKVGGRSYAEYLSSLPSATRNTVRRKSRKLGRSGRARIDIVTREEDLDAALRAYHAVYRASWKVPEPYPGFIEGWARICACRGWLRLGVIHVDGEPAAAQWWIVRRGVASIYKLAYDERFADLSVGSVLTARLMEHVIDHDRVEVVDYLTGDDAYKAAWMSHRRERWGLMAFNSRSPRGLLGAARRIGGRVLKQALRRLVPGPSAARPLSRTPPTPNRVDPRESA